jgi:hypothetical protein
LALVRSHWHIEHRCHWRRDATFGEDRCTVRQAHVATVLAGLISAILALFDHLKITNARELCLGCSPANCTGSAHFTFMTFEKSWRQTRLTPAQQGLAWRCCAGMTVCG